MIQTKEKRPASWSEVHSSETRRRRIFVGSAVFIIASVIFIGAAWIIIYSPLFHIKSIEVTGNETISNDEILSLASAKISNGSFWEKILGERNMLVWPKNFSESDFKLVPRLKSLAVKKDYRKGKIKVAVEEKQPFGAWCLRQAQISADDTQISADTDGNIGDNLRNNPRQSATDCWWFDSDGTIFKKAIYMEGSLVTVVNDYSQKKVGLNSKILPDEFMSNTFSVFRAVSSSGLRVKEIRLNSLELQELEIDTYDGPKIYFSLRFPADNTAEVINSLKKSPGLAGLQYVDFRVENRAYYK